MRNLTMMTDLYELTMMNGYLRFGMENNRACFDIFYRKQGDMTAYAVAAKVLEQANRLMSGICTFQMMYRLSAEA